MALSHERQTASATYPAELVAVGNHLSGTLSAPSQWFARPDGANWLNLQILGTQAAARYRVDNNEATATVGFQITTGNTSLIPVSGTGVSVAPEAAGATYQAQWFR